jgi:hypothetical protein
MFNLRFNFVTSYLILLSTDTLLISFVVSNVQSASLYKNNLDFANNDIFLT